MNQQHIDFTRGDQLGLLREMRLEATEGADGVKVSGAVLMAVLRQIDELSGYRPGQVSECFASHQTIAEACGYSRRQTIRAIAVLEQMSLITKEVKFHPMARMKLCHYRIVWNELALLEGRPKCRGVTLVTADQSAVVTDQSAVVTDQSAVVTDQSAVVTHNPLYPPLSASIRLGNSVREEEEEEIFDCSRSGSVAAILQDAGISRNVAHELAGKHPLTVSEVDQIVRTFRANKGRFSSPGAIDWRIRNGTWPVPGIREAPTREELAAAAKRDRQEHDRQAAEVAAADGKQQELLARWESMPQDVQAYWLDEARRSSSMLARSQDMEVLTLKAAELAIMEAAT